ncbi:hypothetical protein T492DRAFT_836674 [Pavlovales sp. CCMP2436]|nr:hypothetical protein T492DRAFT_836674 [Pavlovales sp. CCMP2436]
MAAAGSCTVSGSAAAVTRLGAAKLTVVGGLVGALLGFAAGFKVGEAIYSDETERKRVGNTVRLVVATAGVTITVALLQYAVRTETITDSHLSVCRPPASAPKVSSHLPAPARSALCRSLALGSRLAARWCSN